jgi:hypothetical protein
VKWEYHTITLIAERMGQDEHRIGETHVQKLDALGAEGWELVSVVAVPSMDDVLRDVTYVFKRQLQPSRWK